MAEETCGIKRVEGIERENGGTFQRRVDWDKRFNVEITSRAYVFLDSERERISEEENALQ